MADRVVVDSRLGREGLRPAASPTDTFVRPEKESGLLSLAESLKEFAPAVSGVISAVEENKRRKANKAEVEQKEDMRQAAQLSAFKMGNALKTHMEQFSGETDPAKLEAHAKSFTDDWALKATGDASFDMRSFNQQAQAITQSALSGVLERASTERRKVQEQEFGMLVGEAVKGEINFTREEGRPERIKNAIASLRARGFELGIQGSRLNELVFDNIAQLAIADGKPELAEILFTVPTGPNGKSTLGDIPEYREKIAKAVNLADAAEDRKEKNDTKNKKAQGDMHVQAMNAGILEAIRLGQDPSTLDISFFKAAMNEVDPNRVNELEAMRQSFAQGYKRQTLPVIEAHLFDRLYDPDSPMTFDELRKQWHNGGMSNKTYDDFHKKIESRDRIRRVRKAAHPDTLMRVGIQMIGEAVDASGAIPEDRPMKKGELRRELRRRMWEWLETEEGQKATESVIREQARFTAETLTDGI